LARSAAVALAATALAVGCASVMRPTGPAPPPVRTASPEAPIYYVVHVEGRGLPAEVTLNGVPVAAVDADARATATAQVNMWVRPGSNLLGVRGHLDRAVGHDNSPPGLSVRLWRGRSTIEGESGTQVLVRIGWIPPKGTGSRASPPAPFEHSQSFTADPAPPSELWPQARAVALDAGTRSAVSALALSLEQALRRKDAEAAAALLDWKTTDVARALYQPAAEAQAYQRETLQNVLADRAFAIEALDPGGLSFDSFADGHLVRLSRKSGPALQARLSEGGRFVMQLYAANVAGRWIIVR
jgi:hypothetical protein